MKSIFFAAILVLLSVSTMEAQKTFSVEGKVLRSDTKQELPGATISITPINQASITDISGFFAFDLPAGEYEIQVKLRSFKIHKEKLVIKEDQEKLEIRLKDINLVVDRQLPKKK